MVSIFRHPWAMCCQVNDGAIIESTKIENILRNNNGVESTFSHSLIDENSLKNGRKKIKIRSALISAIISKKSPILWSSNVRYFFFASHFFSAPFFHAQALSAFALIQSTSHCVCKFLFALNSCFSSLKIDCKSNLDNIVCAVHGWWKMEVELISFCVLLISI